MEKLKKIKLSNQMKWMILVGVILLTLVILSVGRIINYAKATSTMAKTEQNEIPEEVIEQANLVSTSKLSPEELKKLNEEELKKAEEKKQQEDNKNNQTTNKTTKPAQNKYYIKVNYGAQVVTIYTYDKNGKYTVPVKACVCSTGAATPTSGVYRMSWKATWGKLFGNVWGQYCTQIVGDILFHSVPYKQNRKDTLVSAYYDRLGTKDSMGCIRLTTIDALWIYNNCPSGTQVEFYSSSNPGPLGKPSAAKVSTAPGKLKNWDPTDPDPSNPWRTYKPSQGDTQNSNTNTNTDANTNNNTNTNTNFSNNTNTNNDTNINTNTNNSTDTNTDTNININIDINNNTTNDTQNTEQPTNTTDPTTPTNQTKPEQPVTPNEGNHMEENGEVITNSPIATN